MIQCARCGGDLTAEEAGKPCPNCGSKDRNVDAPDHAVGADLARKQAFLGNFRIARNLFAHPRVETDRSHPNADEAARAIARAAIWLTPKSVWGFNEAAFSELGPAQQSALTAAVRAFLHVATKVPPNEPATPEQLTAARTAFSKILEILTPYLPTPEEGKTVEKVLQTVDLPSWVLNWDYELASDEDGTPALWVNLYADEQVAPRKEFGRAVMRLTAKIREALSAAGVERWPYIRMRTALEHKAG
jgi:hypothetical protein